ncbi:MAG: hypothetical protein JNL83_28165 [Myxococcales bacterium]|nr:hypothetical protein [Myxococcales bacterium]
MRSVLVLVLALGCKTDDASQPKPTAARPAATSPSTPPPPPPEARTAPPPEAPPEPTKSQQALAARMAVLSKVTIAAKKNQGDCAALASAAVALGNDMRATAGVRADLDAADAAIEKRQLDQALAMVLKAARGCETAALDPLTDQLSDSASSK